MRRFDYGSCYFTLKTEFIYYNLLDKIMMQDWYFCVVLFYNKNMSV